MQPNSNRYTVGKQLRKLKGLRRRDPTATIIQPKKQLADYIHHLKQHGVVMKDLAVAQFKTKNGLPYYGLVATQLFKTNKIFIRVPVKCLLNTRVAFFSDIQSFFQQNPQYFSKEMNDNWQDHILLAFILYEHGKGEKSEWYHLINNLPREIDYLAFWRKEEFQMLEDRVAEKMAGKEYDKYMKQTDQFINIARKYPHFYPPTLLKQQNIRWIHIHLVTRCFGKYFEYTTMVPFAELLNHQCSDVYYTMYYEPDNPHNPQEEFYEEKELTEEQIQQLDTSDGTYNSEEFDDEEELWAKGEEKKEEEEEEEGVSEEEIEKMVRDTRNYLWNFFNFGDNVSLGYLLETYEALQTVRTAKISPALKKIQISRIQGSNSLYLNLVKWFHSKIKSSAYATKTFAQRKPKNEPTEPAKVQPDKKYFPEVWEDQKFDEFLMLCSTKDQFQKNSQVFFCYGRLSNRMLLMRYGIAIEHNKYNHIFLRLDAQKFSKGYTAYPNVVAQCKMSRLIKIKVKRTKMCVQLLTLLRGLEWKLHNNVQSIFYVTDKSRQLQILSSAIKIYEQQLSQFTHSRQQNERRLTDPKVQYHEYFAIVFKVEKQRILQAQIRLAKIARVILERVVEKKLELKVAMMRVHDLEDAEQMKRHRLMMRNYFDAFFK